MKIVLLLSFLLNMGLIVYLLKKLNLTVKTKASQEPTPPESKKARTMIDEEPEPERPYQIWDINGGGNRLTGFGKYESIKEAREFLDSLEISTPGLSRGYEIRPI